MFLAQWHQNKGGKKSADAVSCAADIDATLAKAPTTMASIIPATYALLRSSPLSPVLGASQADRTQALVSLWASLAPPELMRSIYPLFVVIDDLENVCTYCQMRATAGHMRMPV
jgi:hypothetical protein